MIEGDCVALYARVSSDGQARDNTIASQIAALQERVAADGFRVLPDHAYVDEGYSGTILLRPALEKLRDAVAAGIVTRIYIHAPDRLVRRYAHQILLIEEFHRVGAEVIFLNHSIGGTAEDDLLLQVQGVIAEYERAKILERGRRGRRHAARSGSVSALTGAPFGYRYVRRDLGGGVARFEVVEEEAHIVRLIFAWIGLERASMREVCRRLERMGCQTRQGAARWYASTIHGMLDNPAYIGRAVFGRVHYGPARPRPSASWRRGAPHVDRGGGRALESRPGGLHRQGWSGFASVGRYVAALSGLAAIRGRIGTPRSRSHQAEGARTVQSDWNIPEET